MLKSRDAPTSSRRIDSENPGLTLGSGAGAELDKNHIKRGYGVSASLLATPSAWSGTRCIVARLSIMLHRPVARARRPVARARKGPVTPRLWPADRAGRLVDPDRDGDPSQLGDPDRIRDPGLRVDPGLPLAVDPGPDSEIRVDSETRIVSETVTRVDSEIRVHWRTGTTRRPGTIRRPGPGSNRILGSTCRPRRPGSTWRPA
jgi:hypothetical protein